MSLNGDVMVMRNGRSTSTVSIYNYPEHLNPFYEDDQHKRLRFWPINKKDDEGRRNSFSLGGLKDMWAFKSFRTKKKSSTLGINKTSESPPILRRVYPPIDSNNLFNSYDRRARYSSNDGNNFQRNSLYRSSLQNVQSTQKNANGFGLNRNDQYRSTIQFGNRTQTTKQTLPVPQPRRYVYGGSVTPQPSRSSEFGRGYSRESLTHGSSQISISTNPFDSDNDNDEESEHVESPGNVTLLSGKRTPRKKRRAPAPPTPVHSTNSTSPSKKVSSESSQANRPQPELRIEEDLDIANLTAEIESFVKTKNNETPETKVTETKEVAVNKDLPKTNGTIPKAKPILKTSPNMVITKEFRPKPKNIELQINEDLKIEERPALPEKKRKQHSSAVRQDNQQIGNVECIHVHVESPRSTPEPDATNRVTSFKKDPSTSEKITAKTSFTLASPPSNRRQGPDNVVVKHKIQVTETVTTLKNEKEFKKCLNGSHVMNGVAKEEAQHIKENTTDEPSNVKPPIAAKPVIESNTKVNNFAVVHKAGRHAARNSESDDFPVPNTRVVKTDEIVIKEVHQPKAINETTTMETKSTQNRIVDEVKTLPEYNVTLDDAGVNKSKHTSHTPNAKHVAFQTQEVNNNEKVAPVPESRTSIKKKPEIITRLVTEKLTVSELPSDSEKSHEIEPNVASPSDDEVVNKAIPLHPSATSTLEFVEPQENSLRIEEPTSSTRSVILPSSSNVTPKPRTALLSESREEFEALYRNRPSSHSEWKQSTLAPLETHIPPEKRRSVKDIIESINRSQRLLHAAAQKDLPELITTRSMPPPSYNEVVDESRLRAERHINTTDNDLSQTLCTLDETQRELERMLPSTSLSMNGASGIDQSSSHNSPTSTSDTHKPNNEEIFKKFRVNKEVYDYRETSPTASNLDWNPVPKPKRSKNLGEQHEH